MDGDYMTVDAALRKFIEHFLTAVDFQESVPINGPTRLADLAEWDSLAALGVIVMCDMEYGLTITGEDLKNCMTVGDIYKLVAAKKA